ncbi:hypothetical protein [Marinoscillum sp. MHG1-6]|uniref:hypothetical protein n=1 Tax=Marinoscillum sp. MHG1-6 TaxID=2959627 RepID=UPI0021584812|nr:hypothetical protein [Marinoscillum sp. MHG1-6]
MPMTKTFTENDLVGFIYGELDKAKYHEVEQALLVDQSLQEKYDELKEVVSQLNKLKYQPSEKSVRNILNFSKGYQVHST